MKIRYWLDSGANAFSNRVGYVTLEELGLTLAEWHDLSYEARDDYMREYAFERVDWGYEIED